MPKSVLEAIRMGIWDFEPREVEYDDFEAADAMPGTTEKLTVLAERVDGDFRCGTPVTETTWRRRRPPCCVAVAVDAAR